MAKLDKKEFKEILSYVRDSYRLLYQYQARILDLMTFIGDYFSYSYQKGYSIFSNQAPRDGRKSFLDRWSWDWLNMYNYDFHFGYKNIKEDYVAFCVRLYSDTGFFDTKNADKLNLEAFNNVKKSATKLVLIAVKSKWNWGNLLDDFDRNWKSDKFEDGNTCAVAKAYDLVNFIDQDKTKEQLKDFNQFCEKYSITLKTPVYQDEIVS